MSPHLITPHSKITLRAILAGLALFVLLNSTIAYVGYQARFLLIGPQIELTDEPGKVHNERTLILNGQARNLARIWLNGRQIFTDPQGFFSEQIVLENGYSIVTLRAVDRYGRETTVERSFVYVPASLLQ